MVVHIYPNGAAYELESMSLIIQPGVSVKFLIHTIVSKAIGNRCSITRIIFLSWMEGNEKNCQVSFVKAHGTIRYAQTCAT